MTSLLSSTLHPLPNNVSIPTAGTCSSASHPHASILSQFLKSWVDARREQCNLLEICDAAFTDDLYFGTLMAQLLHEQLTMNGTNNNKIILNDLMSNVAQIVDVLLENENSTLSPSALVEDLASTIGNGNTNTTLEIVSCIILKTSMKSILLDKHVIVSSNQNHLPMGSSDIPTFQLGRLSLQHTFLEVRSALISWVNMQFRTNIDYLHIDLISDFGPSWSNCLAFTLLIYCVDSSYLSDDLQHWIHQQLQRGDGDVRQQDEHILGDDDDNQMGTVLSHVFGIAQQKMGLFACLQSLDMLEMVKTGNEWCIMLYVYEFYMYGLQPKQQQQQSTLLESDLQQALELVHLVSHTTNDKNIAVPLHPLDDIDESTIRDYSQKVSMAMSLWNAYLSEYKVPVSHLLTSFSTMRQAYDIFTQGLAFIQIGKDIQADLGMVEVTMTGLGSSFTLDSVQQLEYQVYNVKSLLYDMETRFDMLAQQQRYSDYLQQLWEQTNLICGWTSQVRTWMSKNDCIRGRIQIWIDLIEERNAITNHDHQCDTTMTTVDLTELDHLDTASLYYEHEQLKKDVDQSEVADDTKQLREHIKQHSTTSDEQERTLTPANMATLGISLVTLNNLDHLWKLIFDRGLWIDRLVCRFRWEHLFEKAVEWIFFKDAEVDTFLRTQALWWEKEDDGFNDTTTMATNTTLAAPSSQRYYHQGQSMAEQKIDTLMQVERDISDFDSNTFMGVWDAYQEMIALFTNVPVFLKQRQTGFEAAFDDLTKRCGLARQAVEQQLIMMDIIMKFKDIKNDGDVLRRKLLVENDTMNGSFGSRKDDDDGYGMDSGVLSMGSNSDNDDGDLCGNDAADTDNYDIELCVEQFKEDYTGFLAHSRARIPYLKAPTMSTAMGTLDSQYTDSTNDAIRNSLHGYGISLSLMSEGLDQLLMVRQHTKSLQQRATLVCKQMERFTNWMDERRGMIEKSDFTIYGNKNDDRLSMDDFASQSMQQNKIDLLTRLEKELGTISNRLQRMEDDDLVKLLETVKVLQFDMDLTNTDSICRRTVDGTLECLKAAQHNIKISLHERGSKLDALKRHLAWKSHWIKSHQWIISAARKLVDFCVKKARYSSNSSTTTSMDRHALETALHSYQDRVTNIGGNHMVLLADLYISMVGGINNWDKVLLALVKNSSQGPGASNGNGVRHAGSSQIMLEFSTRQSMVTQNYDTLMDLSRYAATLVTQTSAISDILTQLDNASHEGEKLRDSLTKSTQQIMKIDHHQLQQNSQQRQTPKEKVAIFQQLVTKIKVASTALEYSTFVLKNGGPDSIISSTKIQQLQQDDAQALVASKMDELVTLEGQITQFLKVYDKAEKKKQLVDQYNADVLTLTRWIQDQTVVLENRHLNVAAEAMDELLNGTSWVDLDEQHQQFVSMVGSFEVDRLKSMHDKVVLLVEDVATQSGELYGGSLDVTVAVTQNLGSAINSFTALQQKVADEAITIDAVGKRIEWSKVLQDANGQIERIQRRLTVWCKKMDEWINDDCLFGVNKDWQEEAPEQMLVVLYQDMGNMMNDRNEFSKSTMVKVHLLYETFVKCFPKLPRPVATPDHIEDTMASLDGLNVRCQENLVSKNKELDIIQDYIQWNTNWKTVHMASMDCLNVLNLFVTHNARWRPIEAEKEHGSGGNKLESSMDKSNNIHQECTQVIRQLDDLESRLDILYGDATSNNVSNIIIQHGISRRDEIACISSYIPQLVCFMDLVINQNEMVQHLLLRMSHTGGRLTLLLKENTPGALDSINLHTATVVGDHYGKLIKQVNQHRSDIANMIYPVRPTMSYTNTDGDGWAMDNGQSNWVALDYVDNNVIQSILTGNLMELEDSLMEVDRIMQINKQKHQRFDDLVPLKKQKHRSPNTLDTTNAQEIDETSVLDTQIGTVGHLTNSSLLNNYSMTYFPKQGDQQVLKTRPRRSATKITPGQVGKYWVGNSKRRLIYCRVLKSNVVMARVGGGWVELSQFLLDHGCDDGSVVLDDSGSSEIISPLVPADNLAAIYHENLEKSESSASLTLSRSSGKTSTSTRSLLPMPGYTDGYQYVRIDEWGNHLALNMVRVDDHYFIPQK